MKNKEKRLKNKTKIYTLIIITLIISSIIVFLLIYKNTQVIYEVIKSDTEIYDETKGYVIYNERVVNYDKDKEILPVAVSEERVFKTETIAVYKDEDYINSLESLNEIDAEINSKFKLLPQIYSNEISIINEQIEKLIKDINNINSIINLQNYKDELDKLTYNKIYTVSKLSPSGEEILKLLESRETIKSLNDSNSTIKSDIGGIVLYKIDGLENKFDEEFEDVDEINKMIEEYDNLIEEKTGIKVVNNYKANIVVKVDKENDKYIEEGKKYPLHILNSDTLVYSKLLKKYETEFYNYLVFEVTDSIDYFITSRKVDVRIIWDKIEGFIIPKEAVVMQDDIMYVTWHINVEYVEVPVKRIYELPNHYIIDNFTDEEKNELNIESPYYIELYDRILVEN